LAREISSGMAAAGNQQRRRQRKEGGGISIRRRRGGENRMTPMYVPALFAACLQAQLDSYASLIKRGKGGGKWRSNIGGNRARGGISSNRRAILFSAA